MGDKANKLGYKKIVPLIVEFSIPAIGCIIFNNLYNVIDTAFLGQAIPDGSGIAVATLALPVTRILIGLTLLAGQGGNALCAIFLGEKKKHKVEKTVANTFLLLLIISLIVFVCYQLFKKQILVFLGVPDDLMEPTECFVGILCNFFVLHALSMGMVNFLRTAGKPVLALASMMMGTVVCTALNAVFVLWLGMGVAGSAYATVLGEGSGILLVFPFLLFSKNDVRLNLKEIAPDFKIIRRILYMGLTAMATSIASALISIVFNWVVEYYGSISYLGATGALASIGVAQKAIILAAMIFAGISMGIQPIIGFNSGANNWQRVIDTFKYSIIFAVVIAFVCSALFWLFPSEILSLFGIEDRLQYYAIYTLKVGVLCFPIQAFQIIGSDYFQSAGQPLKAIILELTRQLFIVIPLYCILPILITTFQLSDNPIDGIVWAIPLTDLIAGIITSVFVSREFKNLKDKANQLTA